MRKDRILVCKISEMELCIISCVISVSTGDTVVEGRPFKLRSSKPYRMFEWWTGHSLHRTMAGVARDRKSPGLKRSRDH